MKDGYFAHIKNPMTIISLFVGIIEIICGLALGALPDNLKVWLVIFLILFPTLNAIFFYVVLLRSPQNFYGPQDFKSDLSYLTSLQQKGTTPPEKPLTEQTSLSSEVIIESTPQLGTPTESPTVTIKTWWTYVADKEYSKAINLLENELNKEETPERRIVLKALIGDVKIQMDFLTGAKYFEHLIEQFPDEEIYYSWLADSYLDYGLPEKCLSIVDLGLSKAKTKIRLITIKSKCLENTGRSNEAIALLEKSIENTPHEANLYSSLIAVVSHINPVDVERWYRRGLAALPEDEGLLSNYASFLYEKGRKEEALYRYCMLTRLFPTNPSYLNQLGNIYLMFDLNDKALECYEKTKSLTSEPAAWQVANIANLYKNRGFYSKAISYFHEALSIAPDDEYSHSRLAVAIEQQAEENKQAVELEKKGQQLNLQGDTTKQVDLAPTKQLT